MIFNFINNGKTTLAASLGSGVTTLPASSLTANFMSTVSADYKGRVTAITIESGATREVIYVTAYASGNYTIERAKEGTSALSWSAAAQFEARITAVMLGEFVNSYNSGDFSLSTYPKLALDLQDAVATARNISRSVTVDTGLVYLDASDNTIALFCIWGGGTAASFTLPFPTDTMYLDGTAIFITFPRQAGTINPTLSVSLGRSSQSVYNSIAIGANNMNGATNELSTAFGFDTVSIGGLNNIVGSHNLVIGNNVRAYANGAVVLGNDMVAWMDNGILVQGAPAKQIDPFALNNYSITSVPNNVVNTCLSGLVWSKPIDLVGGKTWVANSTSFKHGQVAKPTTPNGFQYLRFDGNYAPENIIAGHVITPGATGSSQPTWTTVQEDFISDIGGGWIAIPNVGYTLLFDHKFIIEEIGVVVLEKVGTITTQPSISITTTTPSSTLVANAVTTGLTAVDTAQRWVILNTVGASNVLININTLATGSSNPALVCQFYFKGFFYRHWL